MSTTTQIQPESKIAIKAKMIQKIIASVTGKNVEDRRIAALRQAGFKVSYEGVKFNFGKTGTCQVDGKDILVQIKYAIGGRAKNGHSFNRCEIYRVK